MYFSAHAALTPAIADPPALDVAPRHAADVHPCGTRVQRQEEDQPRLGSRPMAGKERLHLGLGPGVEAVAMLLHGIGSSGRIVRQQLLLDRVGKQQREVFADLVRCGRPVLPGHQRLYVLCAKPLHRKVARLTSQPFQLVRQHPARAGRLVLVFRRAQVAFYQPIQRTVWKAIIGRWSLCAHRRRFVCLAKLDARIRPRQIAGERLAAKAPPHLAVAVNDAGDAKERASPSHRRSLSQGFWWSSAASAEV